MKFPRVGVIAVCCLALVSCSSPSAQRATSGDVHPLDVLSADEIRTATTVLRDAGRLAPSVRVVIMETAEPAKAQAAEQIASGSVRRMARAVLYDWASGATTEAQVDLGARRVATTVDRGVGDPPVRHVTLSRATEIAVADQRVAAALKRRGVTDLGRLTFLGGLREGEPLQRRGNSRVVSVSPYLWDATGELASLPGFFVGVDLTEGVVEAIDDGRFGTGRVQAPAAVSSGRDEASRLTRLQVTQPDGPSFRIRGSAIEWDRWRLHFAVHPRRGLEVFDVAFRDGDEYRPVLYRGSLAELMTPYGDPGFGSWFPRDEGDYGMASYSAARAGAIVGADAPDNATFVAASMAGTRGEVVTIERAVAIFERDAGVLWRHAGEGRRARQLVLSGYSTLDNYDYLFHWTFNQDGAIDVQVQLTGMMNVRPAGPHPSSSADVSMHFAHPVAPGIDAPNHQHFFAWRLDFDVDGRGNRVFELNTKNAQSTLKDTVGEWFGMEQRLLRSEQTAQRDIDSSTARRWLVVNNTRRNTHDQPTAYALLPGENAPPMQSAGSAPRRRAPFLDHQLWVTRHNPQHMYASGEWVSLPAIEGVSTWSMDDESIVDQDVVLWYVHSVVHLPRPEDWPVMPAHTAGFRLVPAGFFGANPTMRR
jgi:primary-amine oxidase